MFVSPELFDGSDAFGRGLRTPVGELVFRLLAVAELVDAGGFSMALIRGGTREG